jgi:hypothetical protein
VEAAALTAKLANEAKELTDQQWAILQEFYNWSSPTWHAALSDASRHVGFARHIATLDDFVQHLAFVLEQPRAVA